MKKRKLIGGYAEEGGCAGGCIAMITILFAIFITWTVLTASHEQTMNNYRTNPALAWGLYREAIENENLRHLEALGKK